MSPLQAFKAKLVPGAKVRLSARWTGETGEVREVHCKRSRDVAFLRPDGRLSYLTFPKAGQIRQTAPLEFEIDNDGAEILRYTFEEAT